MTYTDQTANATGVVIFATDSVPPGHAPSVIVILLRGSIRNAWVITKLTTITALRIIQMNEIYVSLLRFVAANIALRPHAPQIP